MVIDRQHSTTHSIGESRSQLGRNSIPLLLGVEWPDDPPDLLYYGNLETDYVACVSYLLSTTKRIIEIKSPSCDE